MVNNEDTVTTSKDMNLVPLLMDLNSYFGHREIIYIFRTFIKILSEKTNFKASILWVT